MKRILLLYVMLISLVTSAQTQQNTKMNTYDMWRD